MKNYRPLLIVAVVVLVIGVILSFKVFTLSGVKDKVGTDAPPSLNEGGAQELDPELNDESLEEIIFQERAVLDPELIKDRNIRFLFFGDLMLDRQVAKILEGKSIDYLFSDLAGEEKEFFSGYDIISANLEGAVTNDGAHYAPVNLYDFAFHPSRVAELADYGFNYFALANNHFSDQGGKGVIETRDNLAKLGFYFSGAPDAKIDQNSRTDIKVLERRIAMISLSMVYNNFDLKAAEELVATASLETDFVIINIHWGNEYQHNFHRQQQQIGHSLIDAGADLIIGHHPHVVQGMEIYKSKAIFYSLGNFVFDQYFSAATQEGLALAVAVGADNLEIEFLPFKSKQSALKATVTAEKEAFLDRFASWSQVSTELKTQIKSGVLIISR